MMVLQPKIDNAQAGELDPAERENMTRAENKARRAAHLREVAALMTEPVAFARTEDAHRIDDNANRGKRHAAKGGSVNFQPRTSERQYAPGTVKHNRLRYIETTNARIPSLPGILHKRPLRQDRPY